MKKIIICASALIFIAPLVFAADFTPPQLRFSAPAKIQYGFTGEALRIEVNVSGTEAAGLFLIYTKDQASIIKNVQNGYLGWHLVNQVDTCVYMSALVNFSIGVNTITWDGKENCGGKATGLGLLPAGEYTYYIWGFDNVHPKMKAVTTRMYPRYARPMQFIENDTAGLPMAKPLMYGHNGAASWLYKWTLGGDPENDNLLETSGIDPTDAHGCAGFYHVFDPANHDIFYYGWILITEGYQGYSKFDWTPNGRAVKYPDWGEDINIMINNYTYICGQAGLVTDGTLMYSAAWKGSIDAPVNEFIVLDYDGQIVEEINMSAENERRGSAAGSGVKLEAKYVVIRGDNIFLNNTYDIVNFHGGCYRGVVNYKKYVESGDIDDFYVWGNGNGDYVGDTNFETDSPTPWSCDGLPQMWGLGVDSHYFMQHPVSAQGTVSFYAYGPDGLGLGAFSYAGEILGAKHSNVILDNGSAYDGIYSDNVTPLVEGESNQGARFCAQDSFKGIIRPDIGDVWGFLGNLSVTIEPQGAIDAGAQWRCVGSSTWLNSGYTETDIHIGTYTVEFKDIQGWQKPSNLTVTITNRQTSNISGMYIHNLAVNEVPERFKVWPPYPNPMNPTTTIRYEIPSECYVSLIVYDIKGRQVAVLGEGIRSAGIYQSVWDGKDNNNILAASGVYLYQLRAGHNAISGKILFLR